MAETIPDVIEPASLADYFEVMTRAVFQAGVSWKQIAAPWDAYRNAFANFDPALVAAYDDVDVERVLATPGILRMPRKIRATIANAKELLHVDRDRGGIRGLRRVFDVVSRAREGSQAALRADGRHERLVLPLPHGRARCRGSSSGWRRFPASIRECARWSTSREAKAARPN